MQHSIVKGAAGWGMTMVMMGLMLAVPSVLVRHRSLQGFSKTSAIKKRHLQ